MSFYFTKKLTIIVILLVVIFVDFLLKCLSPGKKVFVIPGNEEGRILDDMGTDSNMTMFNVLSGLSYTSMKHSRLNHENGKSTATKILHKKTSNFAHLLGLNQSNGIQMFSQLR